MRGARTGPDQENAVNRRRRRKARETVPGRTRLEVLRGGAPEPGESEAPGVAGERPRGRHHARSFVLGVAVLMLAAISLAVWSLHRGTVISAVERRFECAQATWGMVEEGVEFDGIIVRDERVYASPIAGKVGLLVREGDRVRAGTVVAEVAKDEARREVEPPLASAREELARLDAYARSRLEELNKQVASCRLEVENEKRALDRARASRDATAEGKHQAALARAKAELAAATECLERETKSLEAKGRALATKVKEREAAYRYAVCQLRAEAPGLVSFETDGLEHVLTPSAVQDITPEGIRSLAASPVRVGDGTEVAQGEPVFRLVDNFRLLVLAVLSDEDVAALASTGGRARFPSTSDGSFAARLVSAGKPSASGGRVVVLEVSGFPRELCSVRRARVKLVTRTTSGLTIPRRALVRSHDEDGVYVPVNLGVVVKRVEVVAGDKDTVVVRGLKEGQRVLTNPSIVHEARVTIWR